MCLCVRSYVCVLGVSNLPLCAIFLLNLGTLPTVWFFVFFILLSYMCMWGPLTSRSGVINVYVGSPNFQIRRDKCVCGVP
jgi:hypothetical protein